MALARSRSSVRQLGMTCSRSPRLARGVGGLFLGGLAGGVLGILVGGAVGARKLADGSGAPADPISYAFGTAIGVTALGAVAGAVAAALPAEC